MLLQAPLVRCKICSHRAMKAERKPHTFECDYFSVKYGLWKIRRIADPGTIESKKRLSVFRIETSNVLRCLLHKSL